MPLTALQEGSGTVLKGKVTLVDWGPNGLSGGLKGRVRGDLICERRETTEKE